MDYITVEEAINAPGLRLVLTAGFPGAWGEAAKSLLAYKGMDFTAVAQEMGGANEALHGWTGQISAPVAVFEDLPPASHWLDLLMLLERIQPERPLLPADAALRAQALGLSALIAGAEGFGWLRRLYAIGPLMQMPEPPENVVMMAKKYGYSEAAQATAAERMQGISALLDSQLAAQQQRGCNYLVGNNVTATDFYWANFAGVIKPLPPEQNPIPDFIRDAYEAKEPELIACLTPRLEAHRDMMYQQHISVPLDY